MICERENTHEKGGHGTAKDEHGEIQRSHAGINKQKNIYTDMHVQPSAALNHRKAPGIAVQSVLPSAPINTSQTGATAAQGDRAGSGDLPVLCGGVWINTVVQNPK